METNNKYLICQVSIDSECNLDCCTDTRMSNTQYTEYLYSKLKCFAYKI